MEVRQLNYFIKAAELLHFTDAAAASFVTQSTLSQQIKQLEGELGTPLFDRIGKQVRLTEAGTVFLNHARKIILDIKKSKQALFEYANMMNGQLNIGVTYSFSSLILPALNPIFGKIPRHYRPCRIRCGRPAGEQAEDGRSGYYPRLSRTDG